MPNGGKPVKRSPGSWAFARGLPKAQRWPCDPSAHKRRGRATPDTVQTFQQFVQNAYLPLHVRRGLDGIARDGYLPSGSAKTNNPFPFDG